MNKRIVHQQYACQSCINQLNCGSIAANLRWLDEAKLGTSESRKYWTFRKHLKHHGYAYPLVIQTTDCWLFGKRGNAEFLDQRLKNLVGAVGHFTTRKNVEDGYSHST